MMKKTACSRADILNAKMREKERKKRHALLVALPVRAYVGLCVSSHLTNLLATKGK